MKNYMPPETHKGLNSTPYGFLMQHTVYNILLFSIKPSRAYLFQARLRGSRKVL